MSLTRLLPIFLALTLVACAAPDASDGEAATSAAPSSQATSVFTWTEQPFAEHDGEFYGVVTVKGYVRVETVSESNCSMDCAGSGTTAQMDACIARCPTRRYAYLALVEPIDPALQAFLDSNDGNSFVGERAIGIGCLENDALRAINHSATLGEHRFGLFGEPMKRLLSATQAKPVSVRLRREPPPPGGGAPDCYTHITDIEVLPEESQASSL